MTKPPRHTSFFEWLLPPIADSHAAAIGRVAAHWSLVEGDLSKVIRYLLDLPEIAGSALVSEISAIGRLQIIETLFNLSANKDLIARWASVKKEIDRLRPLRNDIIHGEWTRDGSEHYVSRMKARGAYVHEFYVASADDVDIVLNDIKRLSDKITNLISDIHASAIWKLILAPSPPGYYEEESLGQLVRAPIPTLPKKPRTSRLSSAQKRAAREKGTPPSDNSL